MSHPFIPVPLTARAELVFSYGGQIVENVLHFSTEATIDAAHLQELADALDVWWLDCMPGYLVAGNSLQQIICTSLESESAPQHISYFASGHNGTVLTASQLPGNCTACCTLYTNKRGRSYRGRVYHVGLLEGHVTDNYINGLMSIALYTDYHKLLESPFIDSGWAWSVVSYMHDKTWRTEGEFNTVQSIKFSDVVDNQRRRLSGRGR